MDGNLLILERMGRIESETSIQNQDLGRFPKNDNLRITFIAVVRQTTVPRFQFGGFCGDIMLENVCFGGYGVAGPDLLFLALTEKVR